MSDNESIFQAVENITVLPPLTSHRLTAFPGEEFSITIAAKSSNPTFGPDSNPIAAATLSGPPMPPDITEVPRLLSFPETFYLPGESHRIWFPAGFLLHLLSTNGADFLQSGLVMRGRQLPAIRVKRRQLESTRSKTFGGRWPSRKHSLQCERCSDPGRLQEQ